MRPYIPELSERRMIKRAPDRPIDFGADSEYIFSCLHDVAQQFALQPFTDLRPQQISARALIELFIIWWRTLEPASPTQRDAYNRLPGAIRLIDTISGWYVESTGRAPG